MADEFKMIVEFGDDAAASPPVVRVWGEIDIVTSPALDDQLRSVTDQGHPSIVVDLGEVTFLDSTGLSALIGGLRRSKAAGGELHLLSPRPNVRKVLELTGLAEIFHVEAANEVPGSPRHR
jgi:anti-sigma B factor antagonist